MTLHGRYFLSLDPGDNTGWAIWTDKGVLISKGIYVREVLDHAFVHRAGRLLFIDRINGGDYPISKVIIEAFYLDPNISQGGSQGGAQKVVGITEYLCRQAGVDLVKQRSAILRSTAILAGYEWPTTRTGKPKHLPDDDAAWLHGIHYFVGNHVIETPTHEALKATL